MNYNELINLGLSEKESKVYLASLKIGKAPVQKVAEVAKVNRATTYVIIEHLIEKGLISSYTEGKKQYFIAESPEKLSLLFREQQMEIQRKQEYLDKILPTLKSLKQTGNEDPVVRYFEGKEGMRAMAEEFYLTNHEGKARTIFSYDLLENLFSEEELNELRKRRQNKKIKMQAIINDEENRLKTDAEKFVISSKKFPITADIAFFGNKTRIVSQKGKKEGIIIENKEITDTFRILFDLAVKYLKIKKEAKH